MGNYGQHPTSDTADTQAAACQHYGTVLRVFGATVHCYENHSGNIFNDIDRGVVEMMVCVS